MKLKNKIALVTGASQGIGKEIAWALAEQGASVAVHYFNKEDHAKKLSNKIRSLGNNSISLYADIGEKLQIDALIQETIAHFGQIDILVNNAAWDLAPTPFDEVDEELYDHLMNINLKGCFFCSQAVVREMKRVGQGGKIINISSSQAQTSVPNRSIYATSKGGINTLTRQLAIDLAKNKINVNAVAPGMIEVERTQHNVESMRPYFNQVIPWGRTGTPEDLNGIICFLASSDSDYITGQIFTVDGGMSSSNGYRAARWLSNTPE